MKIMGEVFALAVEEAVRVVDGGLRAPSYGADAIRSYEFIEEKPGRILSSPLCIGFGGRWDVFLEQRSKRTVIPFVLRHLQTDESRAEAKGVRDAKGQPTQTKFSVEGGECPEFIYHSLNEKHIETRESKRAGVPK